MTIHTGSHQGVEQRCAYLDEIARRDPVDFGNGSSPAHAPPETHPATSALDAEPADGTAAVDWWDQEDG
jgi:hypothetical protein